MSKSEQPSTNSGNQTPDTPDTPPIVIDIPDNKDPRTLSSVPAKPPHSFDTIPPETNVPDKGTQTHSEEPAETPAKKSEDADPIEVTIPPKGPKELSVDVSQRKPAVASIEASNTATEK